MYQGNIGEAVEMIPKSQLELLKPLTDQVKRERMVKSKRTVSYKKGRLTKRARQWACYITNQLRNVYPKMPKGKKSYGNPPLKNNPRKVQKK